jgi:hypothetical protein
LAISAASGGCLGRPALCQRFAEPQLCLGQLADLAVLPFDR